MSSIARKWMWAGVSGTSGLLFGGVSAMYAPEAVKKMNQTPEGPGLDGGDDIPDLPVAHVNDNMSFEDAFASAREDVGPGGVFYWHGGIYGTYYKEEWDAMSAEEKSEFGDLASNMFPEADDPSDAIMPKDVAQLQDEEPAPTHEHLDDEVAVGPKDGGDDVDGSEGKDTPVQAPGPDEQPSHLTREIDTDGDGVADYLVVDADDNGTYSEGDYYVDRELNVYSARGEYQGNLRQGENAEPPSEEIAENDNASTAEMTVNESSNDGDDEVAIVGYGEYDGHLTIGLDATGDGNADAVIIDVDDDGYYSPADVLVAENGDSMTLGELEEAELGMDDGADSDADVDSNDLSDDTVFM